MKRSIGWCLVVAATVMMTGCRGSATVVAGNLTSMAVVLLLLWSTLNLND